MPTFMPLIIRNCVNNFQVVGNLIGRSKLKVTCHQNLITWSCHHNAHFYQITSISEQQLLCSFCADRHIAGRQKQHPACLHASWPRIVVTYVSRERQREYLACINGYSATCFRQVNFLQHVIIS